MDTPPLFRFSPINKHEIPINAIIACKITSKLYTLIRLQHHKLYSDSTFCCRNSGWFTDSELAIFNNNEIELNCREFVIVIPENIRYITMAILSLEDLSDWLQFADQYDLDIMYAMTVPQYNIWDFIVKNEERNEWAKSSTLMMNIEQTEFMRTKLDKVQREVPIAYPDGTMPDLQTESRLTAQHVIIIVDILRRAGLTIMAHNLIIFCATSINLCHTIFHPKLIPINSSSIYYSLRILYAEEMQFYKEAAPFRNTLDSGYQTQNVYSLDRCIIPLDAVACLKQCNEPYIFNNQYFVSLAVGANYHSDIMDSYYLIGNRGICNTDTFKQRYDIATHGMLNGLDWGNNTIACGSLCAAAATYTPLESCCSSFNQYIDEYYYKSDIDIMITTNTMEEFDLVILKHFKHIQKNYPQLELIREGTPCKHRYYIVGSHNTIELFHAINCPGTISNFHLGCVRVWYDGTNGWCLPSFVSAAMTGINVDIRWGSSEKNINDVILKYYMRGFGTMLNNHDCISLGEFLGRLDPKTASIRWPQEKSLMVLTMISINKKIYNPSYYKLGPHTNSDYSIKLNINILPKWTLLFNEAEDRRKRCVPYDEQEFADVW